MATMPYPVRLERWARPMMIVCPECLGRGYNTIEIREEVTLYEGDYPVTVPVTCYKTRPCWRCQGGGMVREDR